MRNPLLAELPWERLVAVIVNVGRMAEKMNRLPYLYITGGDWKKFEQYRDCVTGSTLTTTDSSAPLCFVTNVTGTLTLTDVTLSVASGKLMSVEYYKRGTGSTGTLELRTTKNAWDYTGTVDADNVNNVAVSVGENVTWNGAANSAGTALSANVTVNEGAVWNLTGNATVTKLVNNGTINKNGYTLTYSSLSGSGTINETTGIKEVRSQKSDGRGEFYTLDGRRADASVKGIVIQDGRKVVKK